MKVFRIPVFILTLILVLSCFNSVSLSRRCDEWTRQLDSIDTAAREQSWDDARQQLDAVYDSWSDCQTWLHIVIDHKEIDAAESLLQRCRVLCQEEDDVEFRSTLADLRSQLKLLDEMERISIKNIL
ncbi:MAG: DUF4363 family protein [Clostridiales bacterium]|nr:DUF4363 family protein [Candidatus Cacconaster stercorequi]